MRNSIVAVVLGWICCVMPAFALDLNGKWHGDDGAVYYLRQLGNEIYWYNEGNKQEPSRTSIFSGRVRDNLVYGTWVDVPKGSANLRGELHLAIRENGNVLDITRMTGGFTATRLTRAGYVVPPPPISEKCLDFSPERLSIKQHEGNFRMVQGDWWIYDFGTNEAQAYTALKIVQQYGMNQYCFIGDPPALRFMLVSGRAPVGQWYEEDCTRFQISSTAVVQRYGRWLVMDGDLTIFDFGEREAEARATVAAIKKYQFTNACYIGRPNPTFEYMRR